ncbi:hypothetical protein CPS_0430 [Colwellia psychrerythraea 34H]|uniref:Uncharacterized protein n=1 Tax=Colwellia psychrerythraea (strain 34H / ATCC BAA-681) TaxID=167879 RepID=Q489S6_COLP3|nr:hypothetical protein CPS_0430 [Colwellia psychrerythraea 34H]
MALSACLQRSKGHLPYNKVKGLNWLLKVLSTT